MNKEQLKKVLAQGEFDIQNAIASVLALDFCFGSYTNGRVIPKYTYQYVFSYMGLTPLKPFYQIIKKEDVEISNKIYQAYLKDPKSLDLFYNDQETLKNRLDGIWGKYEQLKKNKISPESRHIFKDLLKYSIIWWKYACTLEDKGEVVNRIIVPRFQARHNLPEREAQRIINILAHPKASAVYNNERKDFLNICLEITKRKKAGDYKSAGGILKLIKDYQKKYFWFKSTFYGAEIISEEDIVKKAEGEIKKLGREGIKEELRNNKRKIDDIEMERKKLLKKISLSALDKKEILFSQKIFGLVDFRKTIMMSVLYYFFIMVEDAAKSFKMSYKEASLYTVKEISELIETGKKVSREQATKRKKGVFFVYEKNKPMKMYFGKEAKELLVIMSPKDFKKEVKGMVASTGDNLLVRGRVRIINNPEKEKFLDGEILITSMTRVEFVPLMRKAKAIVTNEGGMACHAAIVAREMNKPCITGTKVATYVFKNGDEVELDMTKGIIKKIK